jgi:hypothetical protein
VNVQNFGKKGSILLPDTDYQASAYRIKGNEKNLIVNICPKEGPPTQIVLENFAGKPGDVKINKYVQTDLRGHMEDIPVADLKVVSPAHAKEMGTNDVVLADRKAEELGSQSLPVTYAGVVGPKDAERIEAGLPPTKTIPDDPGIRARNVIHFPPAQVDDKHVLPQAKQQPLSTPNAPL